MMPLMTFVGGPLDGKQQLMRDTPEYWKVPVLEKIPLPTYPHPGAVSKLVPYVEYLYRLRIWQTPDYTGKFYGLDRLTIEQCVKLLIENYGGQGADFV